ncbi:MAG: hypothetical protein ACLTWE_07920 [Dysgonomonas mossii]|uniref:hypothetical protein n=1 Tax=Dysgonomonas mossii TaxID=163665 RepID=UPI00399691E3
MQIEFLGPVYHTSQEAINAFTDILNLILSSDNIMELNNKLLQRDQFGRLSGYYVWSYADYTLSVWQRVDYASDICFDHKLIELQFVTLVCKDRRRSTIITH